MRVETGQHALDGVLEKLRVLDYFDIVGLDLTEHLGERTQVIQRQYGRTFLLILGEYRTVQRHAHTEQDAQCEYDCDSLSFRHNE